MYDEYVNRLNSSPSVRCDGPGGGKEPRRCPGEAEVPRVPVEHGVGEGQQALRKLRTTRRGVGDIGVDIWGSVCRRNNAHIVMCREGM